MFLGCVCSRPPKLLTATLIKHKTQPVRTNKRKRRILIGGKPKNKKEDFNKPSSYGLRFLSYKVNSSRVYTVYLSEGGEGLLM